jgi:transcription elongation GreA/GreB family factor
MSRAFVKEPQGDQADDDLPDRPLSPHPNYVTPRGLLALRRRIEELLAERADLIAAEAQLGTKTELKRIERDLRYFEASLQAAIVVEPQAQSHEDIRFGAMVIVTDEHGDSHQFTIVGEDEACAAKGLISWVSPLAKALIGRRTGDVIVWERPVGNAELEVREFSYPTL